jgi:hypothetical protein
LSIKNGTRRELSFPACFLSLADPCEGCKPLQEWLTDDYRVWWRNRARHAVRKNRREGVNDD